jgi:acetoin utilization protein AcuB
MMQHIAKLKVKDLMRKLESVHADAKISDVITVFEDDSTDAIAVTDKNGDFVGDIHQQDLLKLLIDPKDVSWNEVTGLFGRIVDMGYFAETAKDLMHRHEITVTPETTIRSVVSLMFKHNIDAIPVLKSSKLVGMITEFEILDEIFKHNKKRGKNKK